VYITDVPLATLSYIFLTTTNHYQKGTPITIFYINLLNIMGIPETEKREELHKRNG